MLVSTLFWKVPPLPVFGTLSVPVRQWQSEEGELLPRPFLHGFSSWGPLTTA